MFPLLAWAARQSEYSSTACGTLGTHFTKPFSQAAAPDCRVTHPLLGFLGTRKGQMMPTMPQKTLNTMIGMADAPMVSLLQVYCKFTATTTAAVSCKSNLSKALQTIRDYVERL